MTELEFDTPIQVGDIVVAYGAEYKVESAGEFVKARRRNVSLLLPRVYTEEFTRTDDFGEFRVFRE